MPGHQQARLNFMKWHDGLSTEKPYQLVSDDLPKLFGIPRQNFEIEASPQPLLIQDVRQTHPFDFDNFFDIDKHGFTFVRHIFPAINFLSEQDVETTYKSAIEDLLKEHIDGADDICFFQWRLRENRRVATTTKLGNIRVPTELLVPAHFVHLDQTLKTAIEYAEENVPDSAARWLLHEGRLRILNIWKPLDNPVYDCPLAVCDGSTIKDEDLIVCDNITKAKVGELILPLYNPNASWHYLSEQTPNEVTIMKIVDSKDDVAARCCPHTAFDVDDFDPSSPPRRSIELRALVYTSPQDLQGLSKLDVQNAIQEVKEILVEELHAADVAAEKGKMSVEVQVETNVLIQPTSS